MVEIERKFLVKEIPDLKKCNFLNIEQGYISYKPIIRIRKQDSEYFITQKGKGKLIREEIEVNIDETTYNILNNMIKNNLIKKTRHLIPLKGGLFAELDKYQLNLDGLCVVEVEFNSEDQAKTFIKPDWFGEEVTLDIKFKNENLSKLKNIKKLIN